MWNTRCSFTRAKPKKHHRLKDLGNKICSAQGVTTSVDELSRSVVKVLSRCRTWFYLLKPETTTKKSNNDRPT